MTIRTAAAWLLREPLVHFLLAGALVYALLAGRPADPGDRRIVVDEPLVGQLAGRFTEAFHRPPSQDEIDGLIREYVRDQVYYREALRLGLDRDDEVVIKRMRNKMIAASAAEAEAREPSDAELQALLNREPARYAELPRYGFSQIYLGGDTPGLRASAPRLLEQLRQRRPIPEVAAPLPARIPVSDSSDIAERFGDEFAAALAPLPVGQWSGPVPSGFGLHFVRIDQREVARKAQLNDVRQRLVNDWRAAATASAQEAALSKLMAGYDVIIRQPH